MQVIFCINVVILSFPILTSIYSKMIYEVKWMSMDIQEEPQDPQVEHPAPSSSRNESQHN